jgi:outer membrane lipoprotein-sorting protein
MRLPILSAGLVLLLSAAAAAQSTLPAPSASPEAMRILKTLEDRKTTLKDFSGKVEISTLHLAGDEETKSGDALFVNDTPDPKFAAHFTKATTDGKPAPTPDEEIAFDGAKITMIDLKAKIFRSTTFTTPAGAPGSVTSLGGPVPLPIGLNPDAVTKEFTVTLGKADDPDHDLLILKPLDRSKFEYKTMELTVDKKLQLPVKIVLNQKGSDITTIKLTDLKINEGGVTIPSPTPPTDPGWTVETK